MSPGIIAIGSPRREHSDLHQLYNVPRESLQRNSHDVSNPSHASPSDVHGIFRSEPTDNTDYHYARAARLVIESFHQEPTPPSEAEDGYEVMRSVHIGRPTIRKLLTEAREPPRNLLKEQNRKLLEDALAKQGYVLMQIVKILVMGIAGAGKTSVKNQLVVGLPPSCSGRCSTMLFEAPIRTISRAITKMIKKECDTDVEWSIVSVDQLNHMIASALLAQEIVMEPDGETIQTQSNPTTTEESTSENTLSSTSASSTDMPSPASQKSSLGSISQHVSLAKRRLLELLGRGQASSEIMKVEWVHLIDTGGQPQFRELLPSVVHNMSMIMHVLRLSEDFDKHPTIGFYKEGKQVCNPFESAHTNEQILQQTIQSIQVQSLLPEEASTGDGGMETKERYPKIMVVGTHRDRESECSETRARKNNQIMNLLLPVRDHVLFCSGLEEAVFAMNAIDPNEDDKKVIGKIRSEVAKLFKVCSKHKVPVGWFLLEQDIRKFADDHNDMVSLKDCLAIAKSLSISSEALRAALSYFHQLNVFLYYPSLLPDIVFCDPQVPLNIISMLVSFSYKLRSGGILEDVLDGRWFRFCDEGIVTVGLLEYEAFKMCFVPGLFSPAELIQLLQYLFIAAPLSSSKVDSSNAPSSSDEFFIPCLLPTLSPAEINRRSQSFPPGSPHLLFTFHSECVPCGIFSNVIVHLRSIYNWKISPIHVFSNYVEFHLPDAPMTATLIDSFSFIEVRVQFLVSNSDVSHYEHIFPQIRCAITESIEDAAASLNFVKCTPVATFLCGEIGRRCSSSIPHAAQIQAGEFWKCTEDPRNVICESLSKDQLVWLKDLTTGTTKSTIPSNVHDAAADPDILDSQHLIDITNYILRLEKNDLYNLGLVLGLDRLRILDLQERLSSLQFCDSIVDNWLKKVDNVEATHMSPSWRNLVTALKHPRLRQTGLADCIAKERNVLM